MRILFLHKQILFPRDTGGKIRALNLLKHLARWHDVTYVCNLRQGEEQYLDKMRQLGLRLETVPGEASRRGGMQFYTAAICNVLSRRPFSVNRNFDRNVRRRLQDLLSNEQFDLLICDCVQMAAHTTELRAKASILFQHNVEAQILERHASSNKNPLHRWYMRNEWRKMKRFEREAGSIFDAVIAVSNQDLATFRKYYGWRHVHVIDTAVDTDYFRFSPTGEMQDRVVFVGSMDWIPNQDGVSYFVHKIWPRIKSCRHDAKFQIVGRNPPASIRALESVSGVQVIGAVPDVRPYISQAAVVVVPLLVGGGTRLKIYEAMASGRAVVSTAIGAEGLPLTAGVHFFEADTPDIFADSVVKLLGEPNLRSRIGQAANQFVRERYDCETVARQFEAICRTVVDQKELSSKTEIIVN